MSTNAAGALARRHPGTVALWTWPMSTIGIAKFAALWMWDELGCRPGQLTMSPAALAAALGANERRVREWLKTLEELRLVELVIADQWRWHFFDPLEQRRLWRYEGDPQQEIDFGDPPEEPPPADTLPVRLDPAETVPKPPAETVPKPPAETVPKPPDPHFSENFSVKARATKTSTSVLTSVSTSAQVSMRAPRSGGNGTENAGGFGTVSAGLASIGDALAGRLAGLANPQADADFYRRQKFLVEDLITRLKEAINCPNQVVEPLRKTAWAVVDGRLPMAAVDQILGRLTMLRRTRQLRSTPSAYFNSAVIKQFQIRGLEWYPPRSGKKTGAGPGDHRA